ncbi:MAG: ATP-binding protein [Aureispira sp.]
MKNLFSQIQNLGIETSTLPEEIRILKIINRLSALGVIVISITILMLFLTGEQYFSGLAALTCYPLIIGPLITNYYQKFTLSRIIFLFYPFPTIIFFSILFPKEAHFQYYTFIVIGLHFVFIDYITGKWRWVYPLFGLCCSVFLEWYHYNYIHLLDIARFHTFCIHISNDLFIIMTSWVIYYTMLKERDAATLQIKQKSLELEQKNTQLEHFAYIASHDLNEPLRTIHSFIDIIREEYDHSINQEFQTYLDFIQDAAERMRAMIDGLLSYSRIGKSSDFEIIRINNLLTELTDDLSHLIQINKVTLKVPELPSIYCSRLELKQLFQNLITNAVKFQNTDNFPVIIISYEEQSKYWKFCISDNGIGIREEKQQDIFNIFTKLHRRTEYKGQGIGLSFCKKIVELHQGEIWVESIPNEGSKFYFTISKNIVS